MTDSSTLRRLQQAQTKRITRATKQRLRILCELISEVHPQLDEYHVARDGLEGLYEWRSVQGDEVRWRRRRWQSSTIHVWSSVNAKTPEGFQQSSIRAAEERRNDHGGIRSDSGDKCSGAFLEGHARIENWREDHDEKVFIGISVKSEKGLRP